VVYIASCKETSRDRTSHLAVLTLTFRKQSARLKLGAHCSSHQNAAAVDVNKTTELQLPKRKTQLTEGAILKMTVFWDVRPVVSTDDSQVLTASIIRAISDRHDDGGS
jgi:hypothetical protein